MIIGSSAGAGSEVFHVYRHLRRYESIRQDWIRETAEKEDKDAEFQMRLTEKRTAAEQKTAKKRAKRYIYIQLHNAFLLFFQCLLLCVCLFCLKYIKIIIIHDFIIVFFRLKKKQSKEKKILLDKNKTEKPPVGGDIVEQYKRDESESESESDDGGGGDDAYENPFVIGGK